MAAKQQLYLFSQVPKPRWGGHENVLPKKHWLKRAIEVAAVEPSFWCLPEPQRFGVTPTIVKAMKHWAIALKLLEPQGGGKTYRVSEFASALLLEGGADPYLEDSQTQWLLHWQLVKAPCYMHVCDWFFKQCHLTEFDHTEALKQLQGFHASDSKQVANSTLEGDLRCLYKLYLPEQHKLLEDQLLALFTDLIMLRTVPQSLHKEPVMLKQIGLKPTLSGETVLYACLDYAQSVLPQAQTSIPLTRLLYAPNSPGLAFGISLWQLEALLEPLCKDMAIVHTTCADINVLSWSNSLTALKQTAWQQIYKL